MKKDRFKACVAVYLILKKDNQVLLHLRQNSGYKDGYYSLVSGHLDGNETAYDAMVREAQEEAGIQINPKDLQVTHVMHRIKKDDNEYIDIYFTCSRWSGEVKNCEVHKCGDLRFFPKNALPDNVIPSVKNALEFSEKKVVYSEERE